MRRLITLLRLCRGLSISTSEAARQGMPWRLHAVCNTHSTSPGAATPQARMCSGTAIGVDPTIGATKCPS